MTQRPANPRNPGPAGLGGAGKPQVRGAAWSSSPNAGSADNAWNVNFNNGNHNIDNKNNAMQVRLVRSGECEQEERPAQALSFRDLHQAWQAARRRKRPSHNQLAFEASWLDSLMGLQDRVNSGAWWPSPPVCFVTTRTKAREIHAPDFADRVLHHWLVPRLEPVFEPSFIHDSFSNRTGKGTHAAVQRLQQHMRRLRDGSGQGQAHYLQLDIHNFFNSIHRPTLYALLKRRIGRTVPGPAGHTLRWLCHRLLARAPAEQAQWRASPRERAQVPPHKRLAEAAPGCGLPIGNLTSQFFANVYLNELDHFVKHTLKCRHYVRYVDDFVLLHADAAQLQARQTRIEDFLAHTLRLRLKPQSRHGLVAHGVDFLGYRVLPHALHLRPRMQQHARERLRQLQQAMNPHTLRATVASYWGHMAHAQAHRARCRLVAEFPWLTLWFSQPDQPQPGWREPPKGARSMQQQLRWLRAQFPHARLRVQRGLGRVDLPPLKPSRRGAALVVWVREQGVLASGLRQRRVVGGRRRGPRPFSVFSGG